MQVIVKLIDFYRKNQPKQEAPKYFKGKEGKSNSVKVKGVSGLLVRFAGCCNPVPGDDIIGFVTRGHGVTVHRRDCPNIKGVQDEYLIDVSWGEGYAEGVYNVGIKVVGTSQTEILVIVAAAVSQFKMEIVSTNGRIDVKNKTAVVDFNIRLSGAEDINKLITKLKQESKIMDVYRTAN